MGGQLSKEANARRKALPEKTLFARDVRIALYQHDQHTMRTLLCVANIEGFSTFLPAADAAKLAKKYTTAVVNTKGSTTAAATVEDLFTLRNVTKEMYLELVEKRWSGEFIAPFFTAIKPTTEMTVAALSSCVLRNQYSGIDFILARLAELHPATKGDANYQDVPTTLTSTSSVSSEKFPGLTKNVSQQKKTNHQQFEHRRVSAAFMAAQKLSYLFPIVCQQGDMDVIVRFIEYGLFDPSDPAPFRIVSHNAIRHYCSVLSRVGGKVWPTSANEDREESSGTDVTASDGAPGGAAATATTSSSTDSSATTKDGYNDLTSEELQSVFVNPQTGQFKIDLSLPDTGAAAAASTTSPPQRESLSYLAILLTIMSTHKFPGLDVVDAIIAAAIQRGRLRRNAGYATRQEMIDHAKAHHATKTSASSSLDEADRNYQFIPPVAAIMSVYKGGYSPDTHSVHSPELRAKVQAAVEALHLCGFSEQVAVDVVGRLGEE